jgi:spermidine synthase
VINRDAMLWLEEPGAPADVAIVDFPDPNSFAIGKLYTTRFYKLLAARLAPGGTVAVQATSPLFARASYWCIVRTMQAAGFVVRPYQTAVPSFGIWGFALAKREAFEEPRVPPPGLRYLNEASMPALFAFPADLGPPAEVEVNRLDNQALVRIYEDEWRRWE